MRFPSSHTATIRLLPIAVVALAFGAAIPLGAQSAQSPQSPQCAPVYGPMYKLWDAPFHMYMLDSAGTDAKLHGGKPTMSESIFIGGTTYVLARGRWFKSPVSALEMREEAKKNMTGEKATCVRLRDDSVNGEAVAVWKVHSETEDGNTDSEAWISKSRNILLRSDIRIDVGGALGKSHMVSTYVYSNVQAPAGVK